MSENNFKTALDFVLRAEGGYSNNSADPGGATNYGITQATYNNYLFHSGQQPTPVKNITRCEVEDIYRKLYWDQSHCDELPDKVDLAVFDTAVNMGSGTAIKLLQEAIGVEADGRFGAHTLAAVQSSEGGSMLVKFLALREQHYHDIVAHNSKTSVFLRGWLNRMSALRKVLGVDNA